MLFIPLTTPHLLLIEWKEFAAKSLSPDLHKRQKLQSIIQSKRLRDFKRDYPVLRLDPPNPAFLQQISQVVVDITARAPIETICSGFECSCSIAMSSLLILQLAKKHNYLGKWEAIDVLKMWITQCFLTASRQVPPKNLDMKALKVKFQT